MTAKRNQGLLFFAHFPRAFTNYSRSIPILPALTAHHISLLSVKSARSWYSLLKKICILASIYDIFSSSTARHKTLGSKFIMYYNNTYIILNNNTSVLKWLEIRFLGKWQKMYSSIEPTEIQVSYKQSLNPFITHVSTRLLVKLIFLRNLHVPISETILFGRVLINVQGNGTKSLVQSYYLLHINRHEISNL